MTSTLPERFPAFRLAVRVEPLLAQIHFGEPEAGEHASLSVMELLNALVMVPIQTVISLSPTT